MGNLAGVEEDQLETSAIIERLQARYRNTRPHGENQPGDAIQRNPTHQDCPIFLVRVKVCFGVFGIA